MTGDIMDTITRLQGHRHGMAGAIQAALAAGLTARQIADLVDLRTRDVTELIRAWDLVPQ